MSGSLRLSLALILSIGGPASAAADFVAPVFTPPRISLHPDDFHECTAQAGPEAAAVDAVVVKLTLKDDGSLKDFSLPGDSPPWMNDLATCGLAKLRFTNGTRDGVAVESGGSLEFKLRAQAVAGGFTVAIEQAGRLATPPRLVRKPENTWDCFPREFARRGNVARFVVTLTILPDGQVTNVKIPVGGESWQEKTAHCVLGRIAFIPGTVDGVPVAAEASLPIVYSVDSGAVFKPELRSSDEQIEAAYRACYPPGLEATTSAFYRFDIAPNGKVANPNLYEGSGDARLDEAGVCILGRLEFTPLKQNGRAIRSSVTWELPIRPPR
jgi:hypothetical protein